MCRERGDDRLREVIRQMTIVQYSVLLGIPIAFLVLNPSLPDVQEGFWFVFILLVGPTIPFSILLIAWSSRMAHTFHVYRKKAVVLWTYSTLVAIFVTLYVGTHNFSWWVPVAAYVLTFFHLTTLTLWSLPGYGGAYSENWEIERVKSELSKDRKNGLIRPPSGDSVITSIDEACSTCLSVLLPDHKSCWRCGTLVRSKERALEWWTKKDRQSFWEKSRRSGRVSWLRKWEPIFLYRDGRGHYTGEYRIERLYAFVDEDGNWILEALASTLKNRSLHEIRLHKGRELTSRSARRRIDEIVPSIDFEKLIEEM